MEWNLIWQDYGLDKLQEGIARLFPERQLNLEELLGQVVKGDIFGALAALFKGGITDFLAQVAGMKNIFIWLLVLGIVSSLMTHFVEIFDRHQVADMGLTLAAWQMFIPSSKKALRTFSRSLWKQSWMPLLVMKKSKG